MTISKQALEIVGVSVEEYLQWCSDNDLPAYKEKTKKEFFKRIMNDKIIRDTKTGELISKHGEKNEE